MTRTANYGWHASILEVAESGVMGTVEMVSKSPMYDFINALAILRAKKQDQQEINNKK